MSKKNICLLGFSKKVEDKLREMIKNNSMTEIDWVSANSESLDGVVINSPHLNNPQVQKFISIVSCPCLCAYSNSIKLESTKLMSLNVDASLETDKLWFSILLGSSYLQDEEKTIVKSEKYTKETFDSLNSNDLIEAITKKKYELIVAEYEDKKTVIFPIEKIVFINYPREEILGINLWKWRPEKSVVDQRASRKIKLEQWLFESVWQAVGQKYSLKENRKFSLVKWPQPLSKQGRTEALRIASVIKVVPANIAEILSKTQYSKDTIERFLYAGIVSGQITEYSDINDTHEFNAHKSELNGQEIQKRKSLLGRLRSKLGLG